MLLALCLVPAAAAAARNSLGQMRAAEAAVRKLVDTVPSDALLLRYQLPAHKTRGVEALGVALVVVHQPIDLAGGDNEVVL